MNDYPAFNKPSKLNLMLTVIYNMNTFHSPLSDRLYLVFSNCPSKFLIFICSPRLDSGAGWQIYNIPCGQEAKTRIPSIPSAAELAEPQLKTPKNLTILRNLCASSENLNPTGFYPQPCKA